MVFADDRIISLAEDDPEILHLADQIKAAQDQLNAMESVANIKAPLHYPKRQSDRTAWAERGLKKYGRYIERQGFGRIDLGSRIDKGMNYARDDAARTAFLAIPSVLKRGVQIGYHAKHKGGKVNVSQNVESWTFAAPVTINGTTGNMAVIVQKTTGLFYKAHKVLMPDGRAFLLSGNDNTESGRVQGATTSGRLAGPTDSVSTHSILESSENSNNNFMESEADSYSSDDSAYWESMPEDSEQIAEANTTYDYSKPFAEQVDDWKAGLIPQIDSLVLGATPSIWQRVGFNALPVTINQTHVDYALNNTKDSDHYIGEAALKDLPNQIERPVAIIQSQSDPKRAVVIVRRVHNGKNIINAVEVDGQARLNRRRTDSNAITSVYAATNALGMLNDALHHESAGAVELFYWNKREAYTLLNCPRLCGQHKRGP